MNSKAQLLITHGTSDLQILLRDEHGRRWRAVPDKAIVRRFHEWLLERRSKIEVIDLPEDLRARDTEATFTDWSDDTFALWLRDESPEAQPDRSPDGRLQLVLPKIGPALADWLKRNAGQTPELAPPASAQAQALQQVQITTSSPLQGVLVLSTDRGSEEQEPVATFTFLKNWLIGQGLSETAIREEVFLHSGERLESPESPIASAIAERIENAVRTFYNRASRHTLLIATMGGLPAIKPLLAEIAVLLAGDKTQSLFKTEHGAIGLLPATPSDALRVRRQCLEQVRRGALLDAWAVAAPYHDDRDARPWITPLQQSASLINGNPVGERVKLQALQTILDHAAKAACLLVAIRVETALLTGRWPEAINGSLTFLETAIRDSINEWASDALAKYQPSRRYMLFKSAPPQVLRDSGAIAPWVGKDAGPLAFQANMVGEAALGAWDKLLGNAAIHQLREAIHHQMTLANGWKFRLADYRNVNTHGVMTQEEIDEALIRFMCSNLWSQGINTPANRPKPGKCFIGRSLVTGVIRSLIGADAEPVALYQDLLGQLEARLIDPTFIQT